MENDNISPTEKLFGAILSGDSEMVKKAISGGADINSKLNGIGYTPLGLATYEGEAEIVEALVKAGAPVPINALEPLGAMDITDYMIDPIELEPVYAHVALLLISHGASAKINDYEGKPLIESFPEKNYPNIHRVLRDALTGLSAKS